MNKFSTKVLITIGLCIVGLCKSEYAFSQENKTNSDYVIETNNAWFVDAGRQALLSAHYERELQLNNTFILTGHFGLGGIPGNHDTVYSGFDGHYTIFTGVAMLIGIRSLHLEIGLDPQIYYTKGTTFCNLDGNFGIRYQNFKRGKIFCQLSFTPILNSSHNNDFDIPFSFSIGECF